MGRWERKTGLEQLSFSRRTAGRTTVVSEASEPLSHRSGSDRLELLAEVLVIPHQRGDGGLSDRRHTPWRRGAGGKEGKEKEGCLVY